MNDLPPAAKRQRVDPNAMDDDDTLPPKGQSVLGKRKRNNNNNYYYQQTVNKIEKGVPPNHPQNGNQFMNPEQKDDDHNQDGDISNNHNNNNNNNNRMMEDDDDDEEDDNNPHVPRVTTFEKGHQLDIKITDDHQETFWTTGIICRIQDDKVLIHVPRAGASWKNKSSDEIAPAGTYTDGLN